MIRSITTTSTPGPTSVLVMVSLLCVLFGWWFSLLSSRQEVWQCGSRCWAGGVESSTSFFFFFFNVFTIIRYPVPQDSVIRGCEGDRYFLYLHFQCYPLFWFPPWKAPILSPPPPAHQPTHSRFPVLAFPYTRESSLHRTKGLSSHWCLTRPSSASYAAEARHRIFFLSSHPHSENCRFDIISDFQIFF